MMNCKTAAPNSTTKCKPSSNSSNNNAQISETAHTSLSSLISSLTETSISSSQPLSEGSSSTSSEDIESNAINITDTTNSPPTMKLNIINPDHYYDNMISDAIERLTIMRKQDNETYFAHTRHIGTVPTSQMITSSLSPLMSPKQKEREQKQESLLSPHHQEMKRQTSEMQRSNLDVEDETQYKQQNEMIDMVDCRTKIVAWCYQVIHYCGMHTESVELAMSIIDRFMFSFNRSSAASSLSLTSFSDRQIRALAWYDKKIYQLVAMTSLYTAVKIREAKAFDLEMISKQLARNSYSEQEIVCMERTILSVIQWKLSTPTITSYIHEYMNIMKPILLRYTSTCDIVVDLDHRHDIERGNVRSCLDEEGRCNLQRMFIFLLDKQIQIATIDYKVIKIESYIKAYCILLNALEILNVETDIIKRVDTSLREVILQCNPQLPDNVTTDAVAGALSTTNNDHGAAAFATITNTADNTTAGNILTGNKNHHQHCNLNEDHHHFSSCSTHEIRAFLYYQVLPEYRHYVSLLLFSAPRNYEETTPIIATLTSRHHHKQTEGDHADEEHDHEEHDEIILAHSLNQGTMSCSTTDCFGSTPRNKVTTPNVAALTLQHQQEQPEDNYSGKENEEIVLSHSLNQNPVSCSTLESVDGTSRKVSPTSVLALPQQNSSSIE